MRGGSPERLEDDWMPRRLVVIESADRVTATRWFHSPEYQEARQLREGIATWRAVVVDGAPEV